MSPHVTTTVRNTTLLCKDNLCGWDGSWLPDSSQPSLAALPASWGPSVVEAIQKRNVTCLAKKPIVRDPHIFGRKEAAKGSRAREVNCRIQKWNIQADGFHPILVANARVDWLALKDDDITKKFPILLEGILQDVFSQRASSAWQGAQPQKLTVSMLLPGTSSASERRDLLQSRRQFWPTSTTRHASLVFFFALCCLGKIPGGAPFSQLHKSGNGSRVDRP